jgi:hypothetical protein
VRQVGYLLELEAYLQVGMCDNKCSVVRFSTKQWHRITPSSNKTRLSSASIPNYILII